MTVSTERFTARMSAQRYRGWGVHERGDDVFVWALTGATRMTAEYLAAFLNATVPPDMHAWTVRRMFDPISVIPLAPNGLVRDDHLVVRRPDGAYPAVAVDTIDDGPHVNYEG
jgi:hypothetical protein